MIYHEPIELKNRLEAQNSDSFLEIINSMLTQFGNPPVLSVLSGLRLLYSFAMGIQVFQELHDHNLSKNEISNFLEDVSLPGKLTNTKLLTSLRLVLLRHTAVLSLLQIQSNQLINDLHKFKNNNSGDKEHSK